VAVGNSPASDPASEVFARILAERIAAARALTPLAVCDVDEQLPNHRRDANDDGSEQEVEQLKKEIGRLRQLITRAAYELRDAGAEQKSRRLLRALDGG
jgi:hypothetical protein